MEALPLPHVLSESPESERYFLLATKRHAIRADCSQPIVVTVARSDSWRQRGLDTSGGQA